MEAGFPNFFVLSWWGVFAPARTPRDTIERYGRDLKATLEDENVVTVLRDAQQVDVLAWGPEQFGTFFREQQAIWTKVIRENGIKAD